MVFVYAVIIIAAIFIILTLFCSILAFKFAVTRKGLNVKGKNGHISEFGEYTDTILKGEEEARALTYEDVFITSYDGLKLHGFYIPAKNPERVILAVHGFRGGPYRDFSMAVSRYHETGCTILMPEQRTHGLSEGKYITYGIKERFDCLSWARYISEEMPDVPIYLDGISMGAATVLMASGFDLPENIVGIIADSGFNAPKDIFSYVLKNLIKLPKFPLYYVFAFLCKVIADFGVNEANTVDALKKCKLPILFAHGRKDQLVPCDMTIMNYESYDHDKVLMIGEEATHGLTYLTDSEEYTHKILRFFENCEKKGEA